VLKWGFDTNRKRRGEADGHGSNNSAAVVWHSQTRFWQTGNGRHRTSFLRLTSLTTKGAGPPKKYETHASVPKAFSQLKLFLCVYSSATEPPFMLKELEGQPMVRHSAASPQSVQISLPNYFHVLPQSSSQDSWYW
jgi:hypothetical protein